MKRIYLDNSATSFPKAPHLAEKLRDYVLNDDGAVNRTYSEASIRNLEMIAELRAKLCRFYNGPSDECIIFTHTITEALNTLVNGYFTKGDHVIISPYEHNAVLRSLTLHEIGYSLLPLCENNRVDTAAAESLIRRNTKGIICTAASNVNGSIIDLRPLGATALKHGLKFIVDTAQASPYIDIDMKRDNITALAYTAHKGFLSIEGSGGFIIQKGEEKNIRVLIAGGSGSDSGNPYMPEMLPDKFEAGTFSTPSLYSFSYSFDYVLSHLDEIRKKSKENTEYLKQALMRIKGIKVVESGNEEDIIPIISVTSEKDLSLIALSLSEKCGAEVRVGIHCSPLAHKALGTYPVGTLRFSPSCFTAKEELDAVINALKETAE